MTINVGEVVDIPTMAVNSGGSVDEGGVFTFSDTCLKARDADGPSYSLIYTVTQEPTHGTLTKSGALMKISNIESTTFTQNDIANGTVLYHHDGSEAPADTFKFVVRDTDGGESEESTFLITINNVNDPPVFTGVPNLIINEDETQTVNYESLWSYVLDPDNPDSTLQFTISHTCPNIETENLDGCFQLCGIENWNGETSLKFVVSDGEFTIDTTFFINCSFSK